MSNLSNQILDSVLDSGIEVECPQCHKKFVAYPGDNECPHCHKIIELDTEN